MTFVAMAAGALVGSMIMWLFLGPIVAVRSIRKFSKDQFDVTEADVKESGSMMKAVIKKQGKLMADSLSGALGNLVQDMPTEQLDDFAKQYGFADAKDAAAKLGINAGNIDPSSIMSTLQAIQGNGPGKQNNGFARVTELMAAIGSMGVLQGGSPIQGGSSPRTWSSPSSARGGSHPFSHELMS